MSNARRDIIPYDNSGSIAHKKEYKQIKRGTDVGRKTMRAAVSQLFARY